MAAVAYYRQGLDGEAATDLDEIDGATLNDGDFAFVMTGTTVYNYRLDDSSGAAQSLPNVVLPSGTAGNKRWILQSVQNLQSPEYENITTSTTLEVAKIYNDSSGTNTHTLPLLSTTSAGERIELYISGTDRTVIINHNASDSSGAEIWTGYAIGDHVTLVSTGSAWTVVDEYVTVSGEIALSADDAISASSNEKIFDASYSEVSDVGGWWSTGTNRLDVAFDCRLLVVVSMYASQSTLNSYLEVNGAPYPPPSTTDNHNNGSYLLDVSASDTIEIFCNSTTASVQYVRGDAALDETRAFWSVIKRNR